MPSHSPSDPQRLEVTKTYKLFIGGAFPRSESGRSIAIAAPDGRVRAHISHASRKDLRDAVEAAHKALGAWSSATSYNRGQVLYRLAEMMEGKKSELAEAIAEGAAGRGATKRKGSRGAPKRAGAPDARAEVEAAIERVVCFAGWADKYAQVLGCNNPVAGPYYNFTTPEPTGVVGVIAPDGPSLLGLVSLALPALCAGNAVVALASESDPIPAAVFAEACATSDLPGGALNILLGRRDELVPQFSGHRDVNAIHAAGVSAEQARVLLEGAAENVKRVTIRGAKGKNEAGVDWFDAEACHSPWWIESFVEMKTVWHPSGA